MMQMSSGSSIGSSQTSLCSLSPSTDLMEDYQKVYSDWQEHLVSLNGSDEEFDMDNAVAADIKNMVHESTFGYKNMVRESSFGYSIVTDENRRNRNYSASSYTGPCIPPDLIINNQLNTSDGFLIDVLPDIEDVVEEQIFVEDGHQHLNTDDMLNPLDESVDGKKLQEQLMNQLTGNSQPFLVNDINEAAGGGILENQTDSNKVKNVEASPGSKNVFIDGMDVQLPAGSIVLAVVNESGSLVPLPHSTHSLTTGIGNDVLSTSSSSSFQKCTLSATRIFDSFVAKENCVGYGEQVFSNDRVFSSDSTCCEASNSNKSDDSPGFCEDSEKTPIIEAADLATLLAEFEASECRNRDMETNNVSYPTTAVTMEEESAKLCYVKKETENEIVMTSIPDNNLVHVASQMEENPGKENVLMKAVMERLNDIFPVTENLVELNGKANSCQEGVQVHQGQDCSSDFFKIFDYDLMPAVDHEIIYPPVGDFSPVKLGVASTKPKGFLPIVKLEDSPPFEKREVFSSVEFICSSPVKREVFSPVEFECSSPVKDDVTPPPHTSDHDYCKSPCNKKKRKDGNGETIKIINEPPASCQSRNSEFPKITSDTEMTTGNIKNISVYNKLPDYVTDVGNSKPIVEMVEQHDQESNSSANKEKSQPKKKLKLSEYRMRIRTSEESRSSSPSVLEESINQIKKVSKSSILKEVPTVIGVKEGSDGQNQIKNASRCLSSTSVTNTVPIATNIRNGKTSNIPATAKVPIKVKTVPIPKSSRKIVVSKQSNRSNPNSISNQTTSKTTVIEIDLEDGELEGENEVAVKSENNPTKLPPLISSLSLAKMPTTSLGHSLLYSRKCRAQVSPEKIGSQKASNASSSCISTSSRDSISPYSTSRKRKSNKYDSDHSSRYACSSYTSRSRSRPRSKTRSHRSKNGGRSRVSSHRKSRRRWSRSGSRTRCKSKSRSYSSSSISSTSSYYSRSRSRTHSKSYTSRSRSRSRTRSKSRSRSRSKSRAGWRRDCRSRKSRNYSRSSDKWRKSSRSRSPRDRSWRVRNNSPRNSYRCRSPYSSSRYSQSQISSRHMMSRHRSIEEIEKDVQERRVIYIGCLDEGTTRAEIRRRFEKFGPIIDINMHFRERGDNYGFVTFKHREHAYEALEHGNDDPTLPRYNLCFGGRRSFCKAQYSDLDAQKEEYEYRRSSAVMDYDSLLKAALNMRR